VLTGSRRELPEAGLRRAVAADPFPARLVSGTDLVKFARRRSALNRRDRPPVAAGPARRVRWRRQIGAWPPGRAADQIGLRNARTDTSISPDRDGLTIDLSGPVF